MPSYQESYPVGSSVRIRTEEQLKAFQVEWKWHHPLEDERIRFGGQVAAVKAVGFYHGGEPLYSLAGIPGLWHEACLEPASEASHLVDRRHERK